MNRTVELPEGSFETRRHIGIGEEQTQTIVGWDCWRAVSVALLGTGTTIAGVRIVFMTSPKHRQQASTDNRAIF